MRLEPSKFICTLHGTDLTQKVHEEMADEWPVVGFGVAPSRPQKQGTRFTVVVTCQGSPDHDLMFTGRMYDD